MKKNISLLLILIMVIGITGCNKSDEKNNTSNKDNGSVEIKENKVQGKTMVDDELITIIYYEKTMKGQYPAVKFNVKNNSNKEMSIEPLGIINNIEMTGRFIISNSKGQWASPNIEFNSGESYDLYFGYMDNYSKEQLDFEKFVDMDLTFAVSEKNEYGGWSHIKDYKVHIN
ncbi:MAG: hypothetical protein IJ842_01345 [Bacilli bacterium]|nr:hypothetical protein [Bacilli bacterium]